MEETKVVERGGGNGKVIGIVAIIIAIIALVIALSNLGVKSKLEEVKQFTKQVASKEAALEVKAKEMELLSCLDRVYVLTMVEKDYQSAAVEFNRAKALFEELKGSIPQEKVDQIEKTFAALKGEIDKGPSPIPMLVAKLRTDIASSVSFAKVKTSKVEVAEATKEAKKAVTEEIRRAPKVESKPVKEEATESSLRKAYLFWKRIGESLVKK